MRWSWWNLGLRHKALKMSKISKKKLLYFKGTNVAKTHKKICYANHDSVASVRKITSRWINAPRDGKLTTNKNYWIISKVGQDRPVGRHGIAKELDNHNQIVQEHLKRAGCKKKLDVRVPHEVTENNSLDHICVHKNSAQTWRNRNTRLILGGEREIMYHNNSQIKNK